MCVLGSACIVVLRVVVLAASTPDVHTALLQMTPYGVYYVSRVAGIKQCALHCARVCSEFKSVVVQRVALRLTSIVGLRSAR